MLIWKRGQKSLTESRQFWAHGSVLLGQGRGSEFWGPLHSEQCPFVHSEPGVFPDWGAGLVLWAGSAGRGQRGGGSHPAGGMASLCGGDTGWPWGGKVTGHCERPHHEGEKYCSLDLSFCHSPTWPGVYLHEGKVGYLFHDKGDISVQFNRDECRSTSNRS